ncbi:hypothetical protein R3I94_023263 [Phoxinus phoxinus]
MVFSESKKIVSEKKPAGTVSPPTGLCNTTQWPDTRVWTLQCSVEPSGTIFSASSGFERFKMLKMSPGLSWGLQRSTEPKVTVREMKTLQRASPLHRAPGCKQPRLPGRERKTEEVATDSGRKEPLRWACGYRCATISA